MAKHKRQQRPGEKKEQVRSPESTEFAEEIAVEDPERPQQRQRSSVKRDCRQRPGTS